MPEYQGFEAIITTSEHTGMFRWSSVGDTKQALIPLDPSGVPWLVGLSEYEVALWMVSYAANGAWAFDPSQNNNGFYFAPYETGVFSLVTPIKAWNVAILPECVVDLSGSIVKVITPSGVALTQNIDTDMPAGYVNNASLGRAFVCLEGDDAGKIGIARGITVGSVPYTIVSDLVEVGNPFTFSTHRLYRVGTNGSLSTYLGFEFYSAAISHAMQGKVIGSVQFLSEAVE